MYTIQVKIVFLTKSKSYMQMQKFATFVKSNLKISILKIENIVKFEIIVIIRMNTGMLT